MRNGLPTGLICAILFVQVRKESVKTLSISEARNHLPTVIDDVTRSNEPVVIERYGKPVATIAPFAAPESTANPYPLRGQPYTIAPDFDEPMLEIWQALAVAEEHAEYLPDRPAPSAKQKSAGRKKS